MAEIDHQALAHNRDAPPYGLNGTDLGWAALLILAKFRFLRGFRLERDQSFGED